MDIVQMLLDRGADSHLQTTTGDTPLHYASCREHLQLAQIMLDQGADVNSQNDTGDSPLHHACRRDNLKLAQILLDRGAEINAQNKIPAVRHCMRQRLMPMWSSVNICWNEVPTFITQTNMALHLNW
jgi:ankyrin repeat protein